MKTLSTRKLSILGIVLLAASAVTAAVLPSNKKTAAECDGLQNGELISSSAPGSGEAFTCITRQGAATGPVCHHTQTTDGNPNNGDLSSTTGNGGDNSNTQTTVGGGQLGDTGTGTTCDPDNQEDPV